MSVSPRRHFKAASTMTLDAGLREGDELCDGADLGETCTSLGFSGGALGCNACVHDTSTCEGEPPVTTGPGETGEPPTTGVSQGDGQSGPGEAGDPDDDGGGDSDPTDAAGTTAGDSTGGSDAGSDDEAGCGCRTTPAPSGLALLGLLLLRRRVRRH